MKPIAIITFLSAALLLAGCASPAHHKQAVMHNPETGDTQRCEVDALTTWQWQYKEVLGECVDGYEKAGYVRLDKPNNG